MDASTDLSANHWQSVLKDICSNLPQAKARLGLFYPDEYEIIYSRGLSAQLPPPAKKTKTTENILATGAPSKVDTCKYCKKSFDVELNKIGESCQWHSGEKEPYEGGAFWQDKDVDDPYDKIRDPMYSEGFMWTCSNMAGDAQGCQISKHKGLGAVTPSKEREPNSTPKRTPASTPSRKRLQGCIFPSNATLKRNKTVTPSKRDRHGSSLGSVTPSKRKAKDDTPSSKQQSEKESTKPKSPDMFVPVKSPPPKTTTPSKNIFVKKLTGLSQEKSTKEPAYSTCKFCYQEFDPMNKDDLACRYYHSGKKKVDYEDPLDFWENYSEKVYGEMRDQGNNPKWAKGFIWDCCEERGDAEGCKLGPHEALTTPLPLSVKRQISMVRGNVFGTSPLTRKAGGAMEDPITLD